MKLIKAIVRPNKVDEVKAALEQVCGERLGALNLHSHTRAAFDGPQRQRAEAFATQCAAAIAVTIATARTIDSGLPTLDFTVLLPRWVSSSPDAESASARAS